jgi:transcriptional regulator with XRE-family HTH domain
MPVAARLKHGKSMGEAIGTHRKRLHISQEKLAEKADLSPTFISDLERGRVNVAVDSLLRIANALGIQVRDIIQDF